MRDTKSALVLIDMQKESKFGIEGVDEAVQNARQAISVCRELDIPVIYTRQVNRADNIGTSVYEPVNDRGEPEFYNLSSPEVDIFDEIYPQKNDIVIDKYRWSAFYETSLDIMLRDLNVDNVIFGGFVTDGCVMTSVFDAFFHDYQVTLVKDMCKTTNEGAQKSSVLIMCNWIYGMELLDTSNLINKLQGNNYQAWNWKQPDELKFTPESMTRIYDQLTEE